MSKLQFVITAVVLEGWGKLKGTSPHAFSDRIEDARPSARRALNVAVCQHRSVRQRHIAVSIGAAAVAARARDVAAFAR